MLALEPGPSQAEVTASLVVEVELADELAWDGDVWDQQSPKEVPCRFE